MAVSPNSPKLLGREVALWLGLANAVVAVLLSMNWVDWSAEQTSLVLSAVTALFGVAAAIAVRPFPVPLLSAALTSVLTMGAGFGLDITDEQVGLWNGLLVSGLAILTSQRVSPEPRIDPLVTKGEGV